MIKWEPVPEKEETVLKVDFRNLTQQTSQGFVPGMHSYLNRLDAQLNKTPPPDFIKQVEELRRNYPNLGATNR